MLAAAKRRCLHDWTVSDLDSDSECVPEGVWQCGLEQSVQADLYESSSHSGAANMAIDMAMLRDLQRPAMRTYFWQPPTLSLGHFQRPDTDMQSRLAGLPTAKRASGGGAIWHRYEITWCLAFRIEALPRWKLPLACYHDVHRAWIRAMTVSLNLDPARFGLWSELGATPAADAPDPLLCFSRRADVDICVRDLPSAPVIGPQRWDAADRQVHALLDPSLPLRPGKLLGSAMRRKSGAVMLHGSLKLSGGPEFPQAVGLADLLGEEIPEPGHFADQLADGVLQALGLDPVKGPLPAALASET